MCVGEGGVQSPDFFLYESYSGHCYSDNAHDTDFRDNDEIDSKSETV